MIVQIAEGNLKTKFGEYRECLYYDGLKESIAPVMGDCEGAEDVLKFVKTIKKMSEDFNVNYSTVCSNQPT